MNNNFRQVNYSGLRRRLNYMQAEEETIQPVLIRAPNRKASNIINSPYTALLFYHHGDDTFQQDKKELLKKKAEDDDDATIYNTANSREATANNREATGQEERLDRLSEQLIERQDFAELAGTHRMADFIRQVEEGFRQQQNSQHENLVREFAHQAAQREARYQLLENQKDKEIAEEKERLAEKSRALDRDTERFLNENNEA